VLRMAFDDECVSNVTFVMHSVRWCFAGVRDAASLFRRVRFGARALRDEYVVEATFDDGRWFARGRFYWCVLGPPSPIAFVVAPL